MVRDCWTHRERREARRKRAKKYARILRVAKALAGEPEGRDVKIGGILFSLSVFPATWATLASPWTGYYSPSLDGVLVRSVTHS